MLFFLYCFSIATFISFSISTIWYFFRFLCCISNRLFFFFGAFENGCWHSFIHGKLLIKSDVFVEDVCLWKKYVPEERSNFHHQSKYLINLSSVSSKKGFQRVFKHSSSVQVFDKPFFSKFKKGFSRIIF